LLSLSSFISKCKKRKFITPLNGVLAHREQKKKIKNGD